MLNCEMNVGMLKEAIKGYPDDMPVFVACEGRSNYDFGTDAPVDGTDTFVILHEDKVFITDDKNIDGVFI